MTPQYPDRDVPNAGKLYCTWFDSLWYVPLKQITVVLLIGFSV
jgi:hypothetical protein